MSRSRRRTVASWIALALATALMFAASARAQSALGLLREEAASLGALIEIRNRLVTAELELARARRERASLAHVLESARSLRAAGVRRTAALRRLLRSRFRRLIRRPRRGLLSLLLRAGTVDSVRRRRRAIARAVQRDLRRLAEYHHEVASLEATTKLIAQQEARSRQLAAVVSSRRSQLDRLLRQQRESIARLRLRGTRSKLRRARRAARRRLRRLVASLRSELAQGDAWWRLRGRLPHPIDGDIMVRFGPVREPPFGTVRFHAGWFYAATAGAPIVAVYPGRVVHVGSLAGYGNIVIVDHGGFHTLSGRLDDIQVEVGRDLRAGEVIGKVSSEGTLRGRGLYFEIRRHGRPVDPARWIRPRDARRAALSVDRLRAEK